MPPVSPRKMKACFLEEGKMGNANASSKIHIKGDHMQIHREFYIDGGTEVPVISQDSVLVQVKACGLTRPPYNAFREVSPTADNIKTRLPVGCEVSGIIQSCGTEVTTLRPGDSVVGIIPMDYGQSGCAEYVVLNEYDVVKKPTSVSYVEAAGCIGDAVKAYTALHYLGRMCSGETVLILNGASPAGSVAIQLAMMGGVKVLTTAASAEELLYLQNFQPTIGHIIDMTTRSSALRASCLEETAGHGVDLILDLGCSQYPIDGYVENERILPPKYDVISCMAVGGRWITSQPDLQLDSNNSRLLWLKCGSVGYLNEHSWVLSPAQAGRYQHILLDIMEKLADRSLRPNIHHTVMLDGVPDAMKTLDTVRVGKVVMAS